MEILLFAIAAVCLLLVLLHKSKKRAKKRLKALELEESRLVALKLKKEENKKRCLEQGHIWDECVCKRCGLENHTWEEQFREEPGDDCPMCGGYGFWWSGGQEYHCGCGSSGGPGPTKTIRYKVCVKCGYTIE